MISIDQNLQKEILKLFQQTFPDNTISGKLEIYYGDGYAEFPKVYFDATGTSVEPVFKGWDSLEMKADSELTTVLSQKILSLRDGFTKTDIEYWNHFLFVCNDKMESDYRFTYLPELDKQAEEETRTAIGDELYEKFEKERKDFKPVEEEQANTPYVDMTKEQLLGVIRQDIGEDLEEKGISWDSVVLQTKIELDENSAEKSIETHFQYVPSPLGEEVEFEPGNPIGAMNAISYIRDKMVEEGSEWSQSTIVLHKNGEVEFKL